MTTSMRRNAAGQRGARTEAKLDFRLSREIKEKIQKAALASGVSTSDFVESTLLREADDVLARQTVTRLFDRDRDIVLELMEHPPAPSPDVLLAVKDYTHRMHQIRVQAAGGDSDGAPRGPSPT